MPTSISNSTPYLSVEQYLLRADKRTVARLCSDTDNPTAAEVATVIAALDTNEKLLAAIKDAEGDVEAACFVGQKYNAAGLAALTGAGEGMLFRMIARLTTCYLFERRPLLDMPMPAYYQDTMQKLAMLRAGERIFGLEANANAGLPSSKDFTKDDLDRLNNSTTQAGRLFGVRARRARLNP